MRQDYIMISTDLYTGELEKSRVIQSYASGIDRGFREVRLISWIWKEEKILPNLKNVYKNIYNQAFSYR
jgi:hypothetical protein